MCRNRENLNRISLIYLKRVEILTVACKWQIVRGLSKDKNIISGHSWSPEVVKNAYYQAKNV